VANLGKREKQSNDKRKRSIAEANINNLKTGVKLKIVRNLPKYKVNPLM
jgi:hypothetical protein